MLRALAIASVIYAAGSFGAKFAKFLLIPLYVRYLSPEEVGAVVFLEALLLACSRLFPLGLAHSVKRFYLDLRDTAHADCYANTLWLATLAFGLVGVIAFGTLAYSFPIVFSANIPANLVLLALLAGALRSAQFIPMQRFIVRRDALRHGLCEIGELLTQVSLICFFIVRLESGVEGFLWGNIIASGLWLPIYGMILTRRGRPKTDFAHLKPALLYALPLWPYSLFSWALTFADRIVLERLVPLAEVGIYGIGYQLASVIPILALAMVNAWLPRYFVHASSMAGQQTYLRVLNVYCALVALAVLAVYSLSPEIIALVTVPDFAPAARIMQVVVIGLAFYAAYQAIILVLLYERKGALISSSAGIGLAVNIASLAVLVPMFGLIGAAWATALAFASSTLLAVLQVGRAATLNKGAVITALLPVLTCIMLLSTVEFLRNDAQGPLTRTAIALAVACFVVVAWWLSHTRIRFTHALISAQ